MWQSAHDRPFPPSCLRLRSLKATRPRATASHGRSSQLSLVAPGWVGPCPKPVRGQKAPAAPITPISVSTDQKEMSAFLELFMVFPFFAEDKRQCETQITCLPVLANGQEIQCRKPSIDRGITGPVPPCHHNRYEGGETTIAVKSGLCVVAHKDVRLSSLDLREHRQDFRAAN